MSCFFRKDVRPPISASKSTSLFVIQQMTGKNIHQTTWSHHTTPTNLIMVEIMTLGPCSKKHNEGITESSYVELVAHIWFVDSQRTRLAHALKATITVVPPSSSSGKRSVNVATVPNGSYPCYTVETQQLWHGRIHAIPTLNPSRQHLL
jgi:hypothetical protein